MQSWKKDMKFRWESSQSATSATLPSKQYKRKRKKRKRNKREANEPESVEGESESDEQEISSVPDDVGPSGHELRYRSSSCTQILMWS